MKENRKPIGQRQISPGARELSRRLRGIAHALEELFKDVMGTDDKVMFTLLIWGTERDQDFMQYVANADRADVIKAMEELLAKWKAPGGNVDVPLHERQ